MVVLSLIATIGLIFFLVNKKLNIGISLLVGSIFLSILQYKELNLLSTVSKTLTDFTTINLVLAVTFISLLGYVMDKYHHLDKMIHHLEVVLRSAKITILLAPALIGTLLITGGALMSCPVVDKLGDRLNLPNDKKATINMVFRHGLYFIFPLSSTFILASELGNFDLFDFVKIQAPIALTMYAFGYFVLLHHIKEEKKPSIDIKSYFTSLLGFLFYASPIIISLVSILMFGLPLYLAMMIGLVIAYVIKVVEKHEKDDSGDVISIVKNGVNLTQVVSMLGIMLFKNTVSELDSLKLVLEDLMSSGIPIELVIILTAGLLAMSMGSVQPAVVILFPMILPLIDDYNARLNLGMFIYTTSFVIYYISPLHMCQVVTLDYFKVELKSLYKNYQLLVPLTYLTMLVIYFINKL